MADKCVVRNAAYRRGGVPLRQRHNERQNTGYANSDVELERSHLNVHFKKCKGSYLEAFDRLVADGAISTRGHREDAKIIDELVFDVNTAYFENHGGYDYAKEYFAEAYRLAVQEAGGEQYVLSAVMHADERNRALSEKLGRDVYHYHLHVTYIPVVDKEIRWTKRCKDPALVGTVREVIKQVSHSKKWASEKALDADGQPVRDSKGRAVLINAYSLLQDRYFEHMRAAGFTDFERGQRGSTAQHLTVMEYKAQQEAARLEAIAQQVAEGQQQAAQQAATMHKKQKALAGIDKKLAAGEKATATLEQIEGLGQNTTMTGKVVMSQEDWMMVYRHARIGVAAPIRQQDLKKRNAALERENADMAARLAQYGEGVGITDTMQYHQAKQRAPQRMAEAISDILRQPPERQALARDAKRNPRSKQEPEL